jgi:hypothetical protein
MFSGALYGWTLASVSIFDDAKGLVPNYLLKKNRYKIHEKALILSSVIGFLISLLGTTAAEPLMDIGTSLCLAVYLGCIIASGIHIFKKDRKFSNVILWLIGASYTVVAFSGAPIMANLIALVAILISASAYVFI